MVGTGYELTKAFYEEVAQNEAMQLGCKAHHQSLYSWICELRNRTKREVLDLPVMYTMQMSFIGSQHTLAKAIDDLAAWGIIDVLMQTKGYGTKVRIAIAYLQKHCNCDATIDGLAIANMQMQCNTSANAVQTTKRNKKNKTDKTTNPPKSPKGEEGVELSSLPFQSNAFQQAWQEWITFRKERKKTLTPTSIGKQFKLLAGYTEAEAIAILEQSIRNGWQGLFEIQPTTTSRHSPNILKTALVSRPTQLNNIR